MEAQARPGGIPLRRGADDGVVGGGNDQTLEPAPGKAQLEVMEAIQHGIHRRFGGGLQDHPEQAASAGEIPLPQGMAGIGGQRRIQHPVHFRSALQPSGERQRGLGLLAQVDGQFILGVGSGGQRADVVNALDVLERAGGTERGVLEGQRLSQLDEVIRIGGDGYSHVCVSFLVNLVLAAPFPTFDSVRQTVRPCLPSHQTVSSRSFPHFFWQIIDFYWQNSGFWCSQTHFRGSENNFLGSRNDFWHRESHFPDVENEFPHAENDFGGSENEFPNPENDFGDVKTEFGSFKSDFPNPKSQLPKAGTVSA